MALNEVGSLGHATALIERTGDERARARAPAPEPEPDEGRSARSAQPSAEDEARAGVADPKRPPLAPGAGLDAIRRLRRAARPTGEGAEHAPATTGLAPNGPEPSPPHRWTPIPPPGMPVAAGQAPEAQQGGREDTSGVSDPASHPDHTDDDGSPLAAAHRAAAAARARTARIRAERPTVPPKPAHIRGPTRSLTPQPAPLVPEAATQTLAPENLRFDDLEPASEPEVRRPDTPTSPPAPPVQQHADRAAPAADPVVPALAAATATDDPAQATATPAQSFLPEPVSSRPPAVLPSPEDAVADPDRTLTAAAPATFQEAFETSLRSIDEGRLGPAGDGPTVLVAAAPDDAFEISTADAGADPGMPRRERGRIDFRPLARRAKPAHASPLSSPEAVRPRWGLFRRGEASPRRTSTGKAAATRRTNPSEASAANGSTATTRTARFRRFAEEVGRSPESENSGEFWSHTPSELALQQQARARGGFWRRVLRLFGLVSA